MRWPPRSRSRTGRRRTARTGARTAPRCPDALVIDLDLAAVPLGKELGHAPDQQVCRQPLTPLHPLVRLTLEAGERRHDEEVAAEVRHRLLEDGELEGRLVQRLEQVRPQQCLVEVRCNLGDEHRVARVDLRLRSPGEIRVHRVPELVGERPETDSRAVEAHHDERPRPRRAGGEGAAHLPRSRIDVDPAVLEAASAHRGGILVAERGNRCADPLDALLVLERRRRLPQGRGEVVRLEPLHLLDRAA